MIDANFAIETAIGQAVHIFVIASAFAIGMILLWGITLWLIRGNKPMQPTEMDHHDNNWPIHHDDKPGGNF